MATESAKIGVDDIVAAAATGVLRAMDSRRISDERVSVERLVASGFSVRFDIWAGGFPGPIYDLPGLDKKAMGGQTK
jgi:hypothetical protein